MRTIALGLGSALIIGISNAQAMGLGEMTVRSYLNQPLLAEIPLVDVSPNELESIRVRFANAQAFERHGYSLGDVSGRIQVQLQRGKQPRVRLTSKSSIHEPVLGVVLELKGPDGTIQRSYDILLDPVNYHLFTPSSNASANGQPAGSLRLVPDVALPLQGQVENGYYQVRKGETLWRIAYNLRPQGMTTEQMMYALRRMNLKAFTKDGALLHGAKIRVPERDEVVRLWARRKAVAEKPSAPIKQAQAAQPAEAQTMKSAETQAMKPAASAKTEQPRPSPSNPPGDNAKLTIVAPAVGEVVGSSVVESEPTRANAQIIQLQEQLEAAKASNEQLQERLNSAKERLQKMEELLRLKDEQIKQLEQQLSAAAPKVEKQPLEASQPPQTEGPRKEEEPREEGGLLDVLGQEQLEAIKASNEQLQERLNSAEERLQKMEELLRLKDEQIKQLEQQSSAAAPKVEKQPLAASQPPQTEGPRKEEKPTEEGGLLDVLGQPALLGGLILAGMLLALVILRLRRRRDEAQVPGAPVVQPEAPGPVTGVAPVHADAGGADAGAAVGDAVAAGGGHHRALRARADAGAAVGDAVAETPGGGGSSTPTAVIDPIESVLEEVDVMQVYGLQDRARQVLEDAIERMPQADALQARRIRLFHEMGLKDEFLRAAREYRMTHPAEDDPHWAAIQAIGVKAYADDPLFSGSVVVHQPEPSGELAAMSVNEAQAAPQLHPPFVQPEGVTKTEPASAIHRPELTLEWPPASAPGAFGAPEQSTQPESVREPLAFGAPKQPDPSELSLEPRAFGAPEQSTQPESIHEPLAFGAPKQPDPSELSLESLAFGAPEQSAQPESVREPLAFAAPKQPDQSELSLESLSLELSALDLDLGETKDETKAPRAAEPEPLPVFDLQALSPEPAGTEIPPPPEHKAVEIPARPEMASLKVPPMSVAEEPAIAEMATQGAISDDDLMLLGLDKASIESLDLSDLLASEDLHELVPQGEAASAAPTGDAAATPVAMPTAPLMLASEELQGLAPRREEASAAPKGDAPVTPVDMPTASLDERAIKLDMAQALIELGDLGGARETLEEVISTQDDKLAARARKMLVEHALG